MVAFLLLTAFTRPASNYKLTVKVKNLRNEKGDVLFALYNREGSIPDENFARCYRTVKGKISANAAEVTFDHLPPGEYAVSILHDEDENGKIKKGFFMPKEGIGFSNFKTTGIGHKLSFRKASFELNKNTTIEIRVIYL